MLRLFRQATTTATAATAATTIVSDRPGALDGALAWDVLVPGVSDAGKSTRDATLWMGTEGAHSALHQDTYGVNVVAQLHGYKVSEHERDDAPAPAPLLQLLFFNP